MTILQIRVILTPKQHSKSKSGRKMKDKKKLKHRHHNDEVATKTKNIVKEGFHFQTRRIIVESHKKANQRINPAQKLCDHHQTNQINQSIEWSSTNLVDRRELRRWGSPGP
jgi:hypothetical protein